MLRSDQRNVNHDNTLTLITLGGMALTQDGTEGQIIGPGKPVALLAYLALAPGRTASREHLVELLWADADPERARHALRQVLWQLRQFLGDDAFDGKDELTLRSPLLTDRDRFLELVEAGDLEQAAMAYTGPFLPAFASAGGAAFEHWADAERERLRTTFVRTMERLARRQLAAGQPRSALAAARRLVEVGGEALIGRRLAIEAHLAMDDDISAAAEADALEHWSREEEWPLDPATRATIERARSDRTTADSVEIVAASSALVAELVGRELHFASILEAWAAVRSGAGRHVHLVAPAGLGKTRLLHELESRLRHTGGAVRYVRAHPGDRDLPFALAAEIARALASLPGARGVAPQVAATLLGFDPSLANTYNTTPDSATGDEAKRRRAFALTELLRATSEDTPLVLLVDDVHWADAESFLLLESMLARRDGARALLVTAMRPIVERQLRSEGRTTLQLAPLSGEQVGALLDSIAAREASDTLGMLPDALLDATGGNPLLILELLQLARDRGILTTLNGTWRCTDDSALHSLLGAGEGIRQRLSRLGSESRQLMVLMALSGSPLSVDILAAAAADSITSVIRRLHALERQGFVQQAGAGWEPAHDEIAGAALQSIETSEAQRRIAQALEEGSDQSLPAMTRAMKQYRTLDDVPAMARVVERALRTQRAAGRSSSPRGAITTLLGGVPDLVLERKIFRALSGRTRWRARIPAVATIGALVLATGATGLSRTLKQPDVVIGLSYYERSGVRVDAVVPIGRAAWNADRALTATPKTSPLLRHLGPGGSEYEIRFTPTGDSAVTTMRRPGTANLDLVLLTRDSLIWLTESERDDVQPTIVADGSGVIFLSSRWSPIGDDNNDVAFRSFSDGQIRRITATRDIDARPFPSPDGTRIGFVRIPRLGGPPQTCVVTWDGSVTTCVSTAGLEPFEAAGWLDNTHMVLLARQRGTPVIARVNTRNGDWRVLAENVGDRVVLDAPNGILACVCEDPDSHLPAVRVARLGAELEWRTVTLPPGSITDRVEIHKSPRQGRTMRRMTVVAPSTIQSGTSHRLRVQAFAAGGQPVAFDSTTLRWTSNASNVLAVDSSTGVAVAVSPGSAVVSVTAGGWRGDTLALTVEPSRAELVLDESWQDGMRAWQAFGEPRPFVSPHRTLGSALRVNGDGVFTSGAYFKRTFPASAGITVEAQLSTPITRDTWQVMVIDLAPSLDSALLAGWDHRSSFPPGPRIRTGSVCGIGYPNGEGRAAREHVGISSGSRSDPAPAPALLRTGAPYSLRLMLGADGRCHVAINGEPVYVSTNSLPMDLPRRLWLLGNSVDGDIAVGRVRVWLGDPGGVDWLKLRRLDGGVPQPTTVP